jgi:hypothetical protein
MLPFYVMSIFVLLSKMSDYETRFFMMTFIWSWYKAQFLLSDPTASSALIVPVSLAAVGIVPSYVSETLISRT